MRGVGGVSGSCFRTTSGRVGLTAGPRLKLFRTFVRRPAASARGACHCVGTSPNRTLVPAAMEDRRAGPQVCAAKYCHS